jgi:hypothetical protein
MAKKRAGAKKKSGSKRTQRAANKGDRKYNYGGSGPVTWVHVPLINPWWWVSWFEDVYPTKAYQDPMKYKSR